MYSGAAVFMDNEIIAALIGAFGTLLVGAIGVCIALHQIRDTARKQLFLEVYKDVRLAIQSALDDTHAYILAADKFIIDVDNYIIMAGRLPGFAAPADRLEELLSAREKKTNSVLRLMSALDSWRQIDLRIRLFNLAFHVAIKDCQKTFRPYYEEFLNLKPRPAHEWKPPEVTSWARFKALDGAMRADEWQLICFLTDCLTEMQQLLVGSLFKEPINARKDDAEKVTVLRLVEWRQQMTDLNRRLDVHKPVAE